MRTLGRRLVVILIATTALLGTPASPAAGVEPIPGTPLPEEPPATILPNLAMDAMAFDLDGDRVRELLTVSAAAVAQGLVAVQAWWVDADGVAEASNQVPVRRSASADELRGETSRGVLGIDRDQMVAVRTDEPAKLMVVERAGREVALVAAIGTNPDFPNPCCLTVWEIVLEAPGQLDLRLVAETQNFASDLISADLDADGTDELFVAEGPLSDMGAMLEVGLLRWDGSRYERTEIPIPGLSGCCATILDAGETDGVAGEEVLLSGPLVGPEGSVPAGLYRMSWREGGPFLERAPTQDDVFAARALSLESGPGLVTSGEFSTLTLWSWQRDGNAERLFACPSGGVPAAVFGSGSATRIVVSTGGPPGSVNVLPGDIGSGSACPLTPVGRDLRGGSFNTSAIGDEAPALVPFFGVVPGGLPGFPDAYVFSGRLVYPASDPVVLGGVHDIAVLPGLEPIGTVGPAGSWLALLEGFLEFEPAPVATSMQRVHEPAGLRLASTASVMEPEANGGNLEPTFLGVAPDPDHPTALLVGNEAAEAEVSGPPGTMVWWATRGDAGELTIGAEGVARIQLLEAAGPNAPDGSGATVNLWVVTPAGHGYEGSWRIRVYRQPPSLEITDDEALVNFSPTISGQTIPGAMVTINGFAVDTAANGSFEAPVAVGLLPTDLRVVAVDPVGNRTERVVSVVWPVDYRRLPFVPIAVLLTVVAALVLFLRRPDTGPTRRTPDEGATFEEIGG
jgi:hypothetical protein